MIPELPLVVVDWIDSDTDAEGGWHRAADLDGGYTTARSAGFLAHQDDATVTIVGTVEDAASSYLGRITIPRVAITKMTELCPKPRRSERPSRRRPTPARVRSKA